MARPARRSDRYLGSDVGISVAVSSNPGSESEWDGEPERIRRAAELFLERNREGGVHARAGVEESCLEVPERGAHFVEHRRPVLPYFAGEPQQLHFAFERLFDQPHRVSRRRLAREQIVGDAGLQSEQGAASGLSWVRGKHGANVERAHRLFDRVG